MEKNTEIEQAAKQVPQSPERIKVWNYIEWYFDNEIADDTLKHLLKMQIKNLGKELMVDNYMEIVILYRKIIDQIRQGVPHVESESYVIAKAKKQGEVDATPVQMLKIHMIDKLCDINPLFCKRTGGDINEGEFIEAVKLLGIFKQHYAVARKHGERTND